MKRLGVLMTILVLAALGPAGCGDAPSDPEAELVAWLAGAESEAEERDRRALMDRIAAGYADGRGNDRDAIEGLFRIYLLRQHKVALLTNIEDIELLGTDAAAMTVTVGMAGSPAEGGFRADAYRFALDLEKRDGEWLLIGAKWGQLGEPLR